MNELIQAMKDFVIKYNRLYDRVTALEKRVEELTQPCPQTPTQPPAKP